MKVLIVLLFLSSLALASLEPAGYRPRSASTTSQYLPPHAKETHRAPSSPAPSSPHYLTSPSPSTDIPASPSPYYYLPPQNPLRAEKMPSTNYLPASEKPRLSSSPPSNTYLPPLSASPSPTTEYLPASTRAQQTQTSAPTTEYLPPSRSSPAPPIGYLPPLTREQSPHAGLKSQYLPPGSVRKPVSTTLPAPRRPSVPVPEPAHPTVGRPSSTLPSLPRRNEYSTSKGFPAIDQPANNYLPPVLPKSDTHDLSQAGYGYDVEAATALGRDKLTTESAKYDFEYRVSDEFGNDYSHKETRDGSQTHGFYSVLLPDGRKQIVHYEADEAGFRPKISYEEVATVLGPQTPDFTGYDNNANSLGTEGPY